MTFQHFAGAAIRALTVRKDGPSLYDVCDPILLGYRDMGGRELLMALTGLNSRGYKNSTLLFNLARVFIARSPARDLINPPWSGIAEPMWAPIQIRHRSAYYDAFFTESLLSFV